MPGLVHWATIPCLCESLSFIVTKLCIIAPFFKSIGHREITGRLHVNHINLNRPILLSLFLGEHYTYL
ncbi:hypothetical protein XENTR_v10023425 [Xenopus tropicalis]|nr:hypothetical protein XENTR_v10023425 [Xenopus tropicalis]